MNMVKPAKYKKIKLGKTKIVLPKPSGLLQMDETNVTLRARLNKQGYLEAGKKSPYSRDTELQELTERLASRLHMWPDVDFAASTDEERKMLLKDLPGDMNDLARVLSLHTGAEIAIFGAWKTARGRLTVHSATSTSTRDWISKDMIQSFASYQAEQNGAQIYKLPSLNLTVAMTYRSGQLLSLEARDAPPRVYGAFDKTFKPWVPVITADCRVKRTHCKDWLGGMWAWQGMEGVLKYKLGTEGSEDESRLFHPQRLPTGWTHLTDPDLWDEDQVDEFFEHIYQGQQGLLPNHRMPQFLKVDSGEQVDPLQTWMDPNSPVRYGPASRLYVARLVHRSEDDELAAAEVLNMFPTARAVEETYTPLKRADVLQLMQFLPENAPIFTLIK
ncbi:hypothetical protein FRC08_000074 [Ceratobasidium sp. 394]|nr:hypothetical protein FRC08_000074 [Ceratobasidium sp. 394]